MAARSLAPPELQPESFELSPETVAFAEREMAKYPPGRQASAVIAVLNRTQQQAGGWLPLKAIEAVAQKLDMPYIRVLEVVTFYTMFNTQPVGRHFVQLCGTTPCALRGANDLKKVLERRIGHPLEVTADGNFTWLEVECLGACCNAPMVQINETYYEDLTPECLERLLDDLAAGRDVKPGSQVGRTGSEPLDEISTLQDPTLYDGSQVGAWRKRFEEQAAPAAEAAAKAEAASDTQRSASEPKLAKPDAGRPIERPVADAPAQRVANGEEPVKPADKADASDPTKTTVSSSEKLAEAKPAPQSSKSYTMKPADPTEGKPVAGEPTTPVAGTPPSKTDERRDGSESKPDVADVSKQKS